MAPGRILTGAADANHLAYENESLGRSYMVEYMIRRAIIDGQAPATVQSEFVYASSAIADYPGRPPVEYEDQIGSLDVQPPGTPGPMSPNAVPSGGPSPGASPPSPAPSPAGAPADQYAGTPPTSTPAASTPPTSTPPTSTAPAIDGCAVLTVGVVHCHP